MAQIALQVRIADLRTQWDLVTRGFNAAQARDAHGRFLGMAAHIADRIALPHLPGMHHNAFLHVLELGGAKARDAKAKLLGEAAYKRHVADAHKAAEAAAKAMTPADAKALSDREQELRDARIRLQMEANHLRTAVARIKTPALKAQRTAEAAAKQQESNLAMDALRVVRDQYQRYLQAHAGPPTAAPGPLPAPSQPKGWSQGQPGSKKGGKHSAASQAIHTFHTAHKVTHTVLGKLMGGH